MSTTPPKGARGGIRWFVHGGIFLVGMILASSCVYLLQPPKPPPQALIYSVFLFTSEEPIADFPPHLDLMKRGAPTFLIGGKGTQYFGNIQVASAPASPVSLATVVPSRMLRALPRQAQMDVIGHQTRHGIRTTLKFYDHSGQTSYVFELQRSEFRAIELPGEGGSDERVYAMIQVEEITPTPGAPVTLPNPVFGRRVVGQ